VDEEDVRTTLTVAASAARVFAVLADPTTHAAIDGTGRVQDPADRAPLTAVGQVLRVDMHHPDHPDGQPGPRARPAARHRVADGVRPGRRGTGVRRLVLALRPRARRPVQHRGDAHYDWSAVPPSVREYLHFPPFGPEHFTRSLQHLAELAAVR
jgi:hypothetical protein